MKDAFGIQLEVGDVIGYTDTGKDCPPLLCVVTSFTKKRIKTKTVFLWTSLDKLPYHTNMSATSKKVVKLNEEQIQNLKILMVNAHWDYLVRRGYAIENMHREQEAKDDCEKVIDKLIAKEFTDG